MFVWALACFEDVSWEPESCVRAKYRTKWKRCVRKAVSMQWHILLFSLFFLIREETGTDVTGSQTGCCDYNTMKMPDCVMDTERPKSRALACAMECGWESALARRCECGDGGKRYQAGSGNRWPQRERPLTGWFITVIARMFFPSMCGSSPFQTLFFFSFFLMNTP